MTAGGRPRSGRLVLAALGLLGLLASRPGAAGGRPEHPDWLQLDEGRAPLDVGVEPAPRAADCLDCHEDRHAEWSESRHRQAWTNQVFREGFAAEPARRCVHCHAPLAEQARRLEPVVRRVGRHRGLPPLPPPEDPVAEGVGCAACHVRDGVILAARASGLAPHAVRVEPRLAEDLPCAGCHEFHFHEHRDGRLVILDEPIQTTWSEWRAYRAGGGEGSCVSCHLPGGDHRMPGAHDEAGLRAAIEARAGDGALELTSRGVGHRLPSGDLFRHLIVETRVGPRAPWRVETRLGRRFALERDPRTGRAVKRKVEDSSLAPGETRRIALPADARQWRLRYAYASPEHLAETGEAPHLWVELGRGALRSRADRPPRTVAGRRRSAP